MSTILGLLLAVAALAMCAVREPSADDRTPAELAEAARRARRELAAAARRAGWARSILAVVVLALGLFAWAFWICVQVAHVALAVCALLAMHLVTAGNQHRMGV